MRSVSLVAVVLVAILAGCGDEEATELHRPATAEEKAAKAVFSKYVAAASRKDAGAACAYLVAKTAHRHLCASHPTIPRRLIRASRAVGQVQVRDVNDYFPAEMHLSGKLPPGSDSAWLVMFLDYRDSRWLVMDVFPGSYG